MTGVHEQLHREQDRKTRGMLVKLLHNKIQFVFFSEKRKTEKGDEQ